MKKLKYFMWLKWKIEKSDISPKLWKSVRLKKI